MAPENVTVLTEDEVLALGLSSIVHDGDMDGVDMYGDPGQTDSEGRTIITFHQYQALQKADRRLEKFAMRVIYPTNPSARGKTWLCQATKYHKWFGNGYCAPDDAKGLAKLTGKVYVEKPTAKRNQVVKEDVDNIFYCREKYPDCKRFFDTAKGLAFHWNKDHKETGLAKPPVSVEEDASE